MFAKLSSLARSSLLALGMIGGLAMPAFAAPAGLAANPAAGAENSLIRVQGDGRYSDCMRGGDCWRGRRGGFDGGPRWSGSNRNWDGNRNWNGNRHYRGGWDDRRYYRRGWDDRRYYRRNYYRPRSGIYFDFYSPGFYPDYYPRYYEPRYYAPRRIYRGGGSAHVQWCYNRYRSYRAWDNTYQPYGGPRRQCWSPYS